MPERDGCADVVLPTPVHLPRRKTWSNFGGVVDVREEVVECGDRIAGRCVGSLYLVRSWKVCVDIDATVAHFHFHSYFHASSSSLSTWPSLVFCDLKEAVLDDRVESLLSNDRYDEVRLDSNGCRDEVEDREEEIRIRGFDRRNRDRQTATDDALVRRPFHDSSSMQAHC